MKGVRRNLHRGNTRVELYNLADDVGETKNLAAQRPDLVRRLEQVMTAQHVPSALFPLKALDAARQ